MGRARATKLRRRPRSSSPVKSGRSPRAPTHAPSMEAIFGGNVLITPGAAPTSQGLHTRNASSLREDTINRGDLATSQGGPTHSTELEVTKKKELFDCLAISVLLRIGESPL